MILSRANALWSAAIDAALERQGLRERTYHVLVVAASGVMLPQRAIADLLGLDPSQMVGILDDLEARELIRRVTDSRDRRARFVVATPQGLRLYGVARQTVHDVERRLLARLTPPEQERLRGLLRQLGVMAARSA